MKFNTENNSVRSSGSYDTKKFQIANNVKAFRLLFSQIYPDIIKAIVREIIANAWDAQKMKGTLDRAIEVHVPNAYDPFFSVRDYGISMTHEEMMNTFSIFFQSTKDGSDDQAGMWGIGGKTPLGYSDSYSIQCWKDGETRIYDILIDKDGFPAIEFKYIEESDEPDGLKVTVGVRQEDNFKFKKCVEDFIPGMPSPITIDGVRYESNLKPVMEGSNWKIFDKNVLNGLHVQMGCIMYRIQDQFLGYGFPLVHLPILLDYPIGTFEVTGSREDIIYNAETKAKLREAVEVVRKEFSKNFEEKLAKCKTRYEAEALIVANYNSRDLMDPKGLIWKGHRLTIAHYNNVTAPFPTKPLDSGVRFKGYSYFDAHSRHRQGLAFVVVHGKAERDYNRRVETYIDEIRKRRQDGEKIESHYLIRCNPKSWKFTKFRARLGYPKVIDLNTIPPKKGEPREKTEPTIDIYHVADGKFETVEAKKKNISKYFILLERGDLPPMDFGKKLVLMSSSTSGLHALRKILKALDIDSQFDTVTCIPKYREKTIKRLRDDWVDMAKVMEDAVRDLKPEVIRKHSLPPQQYNWLRYMTDDFGRIQRNSTLGQMIHYEEFDKAQKEFDELSEKFIQKYPLLSWVEDPGEGPNESIEEYIRLIDEKEKV